MCYWFCSSKCTITKFFEMLWYSLIILTIRSPHVIKKKFWHKQDFKNQNDWDVLLSFHILDYHGWFGQIAITDNTPPWRYMHNGRTFTKPHRVEWAFNSDHCELRKPLQPENLWLVHHLAIIVTKGVETNHQVRFLPGVFHTVEICEIHLLHCQLISMKKQLAQNIWRYSNLVWKGTLLVL